MASKDQRITIVDKPKNGGASRARFSGIEVARGEYLTFGDSDDCFLDGALKHLYDTAIEQGCDIVKANLRQEGSYANTQGTGLSKYMGFHDRDSLLDLFRQAIAGKTHAFRSLYTMLYRRELFCHDDVKPVDFFWGDDLALNLQVAKYADSMYVSDRNVYVYMEPTGSHHFRYDALRQYVGHIKSEVAFLKQYFPEDKDTLKYVYWTLYDTTSAYLRFSIIHYRSSREKNIRYHAEVLSDPIFKECFSFFTPQNDIERALFELDTERAYRLCEKSLRFQWPKIYAKEIAKWIYFKLH